MKKTILFLFYCVSGFLYAQDIRDSSHFVFNFNLAYSKIEPYFDEGFQEKDVYYTGNGDIGLETGYEFRLAKYFSITPYLGFNRNGWSWDYNGHSGKISFFNPYAKLSLNFHIMRNVYAGFGGYYGRPFYFGGELDGKSTTKDMPYTAAHSYGFFYSLGYSVHKNFRVGIQHTLYVLESEESVIYHQTIQSFGLVITYML